MTSPKERIALWSVVATILLTVMTFAVGFLTNSLSVLSQALHSAIDVIAAIMTLFAVMRADVPPDAVYLYGYGKLENLSSLIESFLLFITAAIVVYEALDRLLVSHVAPEIDIYAVLVMVISVVVNYTRSRAMTAAARKYKSQALEADAAHFSADLLSSIIVIAGIVPVALGYTWTDSLAAIGVAIIIMVIGYRISKKSVATLMDAAPTGIVNIIFEEAQKVNGIEKVGRIRVRESGSKTFIDITVFIDKVLPLEIAHGITALLEDKIQLAIPGSDVIVHANPLSVESVNLVVRIRQESSNFQEVKNIHGIRIFEIDKHLYIDFHIELDGALPLAKAHAISDELEGKIKQINPLIVEVSSHVEPVEEGVFNGEIDDTNFKNIKLDIQEIIKNYSEIHCLNKIEIRKAEEKLNIVLECAFSRDITVREAHRIADQLEDVIRGKIAGIDNIMIHLEPA